jgi:hypothetical protein
MTHPKLHIVWTIIAIVISYLIGRLAYSYFYIWTLNTIEYFSGDKIKFIGKIPFMFFGEPIYGLIFCSIPLTIFLCFQIVKNKFRLSFWWTLLFYLSFFIISYLTVCYFEVLSLNTSNYFLREGQTTIYRVRDVSLNVIYLTSIISSTILTCLANLLKRLSLR